MNKSMLFSLLIIVFFSCEEEQLLVLYESDTLRIEKLTDNSFVHISYLNILNVGIYPCNGLIYSDGGEALVFDTPTDNDAANELIDWIENDQGLNVKGVVVNHFHVDCLGGLAAFHERSIPSYSGNKTIDLAAQDSVVVPQIGFEASNALSVGNRTVINRFFGEAHTIDNIVSYFQDDQLLLEAV